MVELLAFVVLMVAAGYVLRSRGVVRAEAAKDLTYIVFYVTLPALAFRTIHRAELSWSLLAMPALAWALTFGSLGLTWALARALKLSRPQTGAFMLAAMFGNTTYLGYPIIQGFYGARHLTLAIFFDLLGAAIAVNTVGVLVASTMGGKPAQPWAIVKRLAAFPPIWALALGLVLNGVALPPLVASLLERIGGLTSPLIMISIGLSLRFSAWREDLPMVGLVTGLRLFVFPALMFGVVYLLRLPVDFRQAAVMQAAMPTMFYSLTLALLFDLRVNLAVNSIMLTTLLGFATLPLWHILLG